MAKLLVKTEQVATALRKAASTLKAAIVVSAAAILSQASADLEANAANAMDHFDDFAAQLHAVRQTMLPAAILSSAYAEGSDIEVNGDTLDRMLAHLDDRLDAARQALRAVAESSERDGLDIYTERVGELGRAFERVTALVAPAKDVTPFLFDQFFLEAMQDLGLRDWSAAPADET